MTVSISAALSSLPASSLESMAARYGSLAEAEGEQAIDRHAVAAIRDWRIDDLVFWQRVRFRVRLLRAIEQRKVRDDAARQAPQS
jgi:hypothetical protein